MLVAPSGTGCSPRSPSSATCSPTTTGRASAWAGPGPARRLLRAGGPDPAGAGRAGAVRRGDLESGLLMRGYVDRLDVAAGGALRVVDYKTGGAPREAFEAQALFQMKFYALVLWRPRGVVPRLLRLLYLGEREVLRYDPDEADLLATERKVALWDAIERPPSPATSGPARAGSATGATTRRCARLRRHAAGAARPAGPYRAGGLAADERPSPHTPGDEVLPTPSHHRVRPPRPGPARLARPTCSGAVCRATSSGRRTLSPRGHPEI